MKRTVPSIVIGAAALALSAQSAAARSNVSYICPTLDTRTGELTVRVDSGCMTGMARFKDHDLELEVDQNHAGITVTGSINYHPITSPIVTADCGGATQVTLKASGIEARQYSVVFDGQYLGTADMLTDPSPDQCMSTMRRVRHHGIAHVNRQSFKDWSTDPISGWKDWRGDDVFALLSPLLSGHPETDEGLPKVEIKIEKRFWNNIWAVRGKPWKNEPFIAVWITRHGFLDDSVSGDRFFAELRQGPDGWHVEELFGQNMCARGENAGQWTGDACV